MKIISPTYIFLGIGIITAMAFNGAGKTKIAFLINLIAFFVFQIPISFILPGLFNIGEKAIFIGIATAYAFQGIAGWQVFRKGNWME